MSKIYLIILVFISGFVSAQNLEWKVYNSDNSELPNQTIKSIAVDSTGARWFATYMGGIAVEQDGKWTIYNTSNSDLPHNYVNCIAIDKNNVKWIGTDGGGLSRFDGKTWQVYKTSTSGIPSNVVMALYCDQDGSVWVGTYFGGLAHLSNGKWEIYNDENSNLLSNKIVSITKDKKGIIWVATQGGGVASFDGKNWNVYTERNSKITNDYIYSITVDKDNKKWIGTGGGGIVVFNDVYWIKHNSGNSDLTDDNIRPIVIDKSGKKWIGTYIGGINVFDDKAWTIYDFQNSKMPDDEITCMTLYKNKIFIGTERSGIVEITDNNIVVPSTIVLPVIAEVVPEVIPEPELKPEIPPADTSKKEEIVVKEEIIPVPVEAIEVIPPVVIETEITTSTEKEEIPIVVVEPDTSKNIVIEEVKEEVKEEPKEEIKPEITPKVIVPAVVVPHAQVTLKPVNKIVLMIDAADVYFDQKKLSQTLIAFKYLLKNKERIDASYAVNMLIYSSNYDISPKKINISAKDKEGLQIKEIIYLDGESTFTEGAKKAFNLIKQDYQSDKNNLVIAATHKFIRDDEIASVVIKDNFDNNKISFSLLAFKTKKWKLEHKMKKMIPKGSGSYYSIEQPGIKDNWWVTGQIGMSIFRGDVDVNKTLVFPGVYGISGGKQLLSTGMLTGGVKAKLNFGSFQGEKNGQEFKNNYKEFSVNFQATMNKWINRNFVFEKYRPYAFGGLGMINYRVLLRNAAGEVINGYGYDVQEDQVALNGTDPAKTKSITEFIIPVGFGVNYKLNPEMNLEFEVSSCLYFSDRLDGRERFKNDKYWLVSLGFTYKINSKKFLADILDK